MMNENQRIDAFPYHHDHVDNRGHNHEPITPPKYSESRPQDHRHPFFPRPQISQDIQEVPEDESCHYYATRPILVGYAFGPKKMSTMGIIMAEASKSVSEVGHLTNLSTREDDILRKMVDFVPTSTRNRDGIEDEPTVITAASGITGGGGGVKRLTTAALKEKSRLMMMKDRKEQHHGMGSKKRKGGCSSISSSGAWSIGNSSLGSIGSQFAPITSSSGHTNVNHGESPAKKIRQLISLESEGSITIVPSSSGSGDSGNKVIRKKKPRHHNPIRVSFVPLDLDIPLEEQHGGNFDAILHKLTEDILTISTAASNSRPDGTTNAPSVRKQSPTPSKEAEAQTRVQRLVNYKQNHPSCCLVDHPTNIQTVMNRADIANILQTCLLGVYTASGKTVGTPRFIISRNSSSSQHELSQQIQTSGLNYPLIIKPLTAAGTSQSHKMVIALSKSLETTMKEEQESNATTITNLLPPCLVSEYINHDAKLYKIYVLGDNVQVFERESLPNLPPGIGDCHHQKNSRNHVEFDSQKPYPKLSDFGVISSDTTSKSKSSYLVTVEEIKPIAMALGKAFSLELFGFDILVTSENNTHVESKQSKKDLLVVDVNYFPSYKELSNFPSLLASYLTHRAIEGRINSWDYV
eukprot:CAMPEP_0195525670 /NCGR_PEP_ID=MMETSP0794_2-20130614/26223_1 /TAXON_ID=515487 /ORGANISM="Stephanopyxis turris, Strain CCMP 815" /LENGTH=634 /DNA_ID=CAMNT_0040656173 /DNA_START=206 /DNA_END=2110 /DNA_ORIENTATION=+